MVDGGDVSRGKVWGLIQNCSAEFAPGLEIGKLKPAIESRGR